MSIPLIGLVSSFLLDVRRSCGAGNCFADTSHLSEGLQETANSELERIMRREQQHLPKAEKIIIKNNKKTNTTKFKLRTPKYLLTLKIDDKKKAEKIMNSIPANLKKEQLK
jgi:hypothetical protein